MKKLRPWFRDISQNTVDPVFLPITWQGWLSYLVLSILTYSWFHFTGSGAWGFWPALAYMVMLVGAVSVLFTKKSVHKPSRTGELYLAALLIIGALVFWLIV